MGSLITGPMATFPATRISRSRKPPPPILTAGPRAVKRAALESLHAERLAELERRAALIELARASPPHRG